MPSEARQLLNQYQQQSPARNLLNQYRAEKLLVDEDGADISPIELRPLFTGPELTTPTGDPPPSWPENLKSASAKGIDIQAQSPMDLMFTGFAMNKSQVVDYVSDKLGVPTRIGEDTGEVEYLNKQTNRWTTLNPVGMDTQDFTSMVGPAVVIGSDIFGGVGGSFASPLVGTMGGASTGAFLGEFSRLMIGRGQYGFGAEIPEEKWISMAVEESAKEAGWSLAGGVTGVLATKVAKNLYNFYTDKWLPQGYEAISNAVKDSPEFKVIDQVNKKIEGRSKRRVRGKPLKGGFQPLAGEISGDESLLGIEQGFRGSDIGGSDVRRAFIDRDKQNIDALKDYADSAMSFEPRFKELDYTDLGETITGKAQDQKQAIEGRVNQSLDVATQRSEETYEAIPGGTVDKAVRAAREAVTGSRTKFKEWADEQYSGLDRISEGVVIPNVNTHSASNAIKNEIGAVRSLFKSAAKDQNALVGAKYEMDAEGELILRKIYDPEYNFTFKEAQLGISSLKSMERALRGTPGADDKMMGAVSRLRNAMVKDRAEAVKIHPDLDDKLLEVERVYREKKNLYYKGIVGELMRQRPDGSYEVTDARGFRNYILNKLPGAELDMEAAQFSKALEGNLPALQSIKNAIFDEYKETVYGDSGFSRTLHNRFMRNYSASMKQFFSKQDWKIIENSNYFGSALNKIADRKKTVASLLSRSTKGKISSLDPQAIRSYIGLGTPGSDGITDLKRANIKNIQYILRKDEEIFEDVKGAILKDMRKHAFSGDPGKSAVYPPRFIKYLDNNTSEIRKWFGEDMVKDLNVLKDAMQIVSKKANLAQGSRTTPTLYTLMRMAVLGPLSHTGFVLGGVNRYKTDKANKAIANALLNPETIKNLAELRTLSDQSKKAASLLGSTIWVD